MNRPRQAARLLRWYPAHWRARYGDEFIALIEDSYGRSRIPLRTRLATARSGSVERLRASGLAGNGESPADRTRSGALVVLCAWSIFVIAGVIFAKFTEHWSSATPRAGRWLPAVAYDAVEVAALFGGLMVMAAGLIVLPALVRSIRLSGWSTLRRHVRRLVVLGGVTLLVGTGVVVWAQHLNTHQRNGGLLSYALAVLMLFILVVGTLAAGTASAVTLTTQLELSGHALRRLGRLALAATVAMAVITAGALAWGADIRAHAPSFFGRGVPVAWYLAGLVMVTGLTLAAAGACRVRRATPHLDT
jgi:hypothetical protein